MNSMQENKLMMYYTFKSVNERFQPTWTTNAVYAASYNLWAAKLILIEQNRDAQTVETSGITTDKKNKKNLMIDKAAFIQNRLQSYANVTGNVELLESVSYSPSKMKMARDTDIVGICNAILSRANANAVAIVAYGVTAPMITELQTAIAAYTAVLAKPTSAKSQTKNATENLNALIKEADNILTKRLDLDIELFKVTKPDFYSQFKTSRIIIPKGASSGLAVMGSVLMAGTGEPVKGVVFSFTPENGVMQKSASAPAEIVIKKSTEKGNFRITNMAEGTYIVTIKKLGFKDQQVTIIVVKGETTTLRVEMEKN
jgi:hypothetical protein